MFGILSETNSLTNSSLFSFKIALNSVYDIIEDNTFYLLWYIMILKDCSSDTLVFWVQESRCYLSAYAVSSLAVFNAPRYCQMLANGQ